MSLATQMRRAAAGVATGGDFDPETDIDWYAFYWAEGSSFAAEGYSDTDTVSDWPDEMGESDASNIVSTPVFDAVTPAFNGQPTVDFSAAVDCRIYSGFFASGTPSTPYSIVCIGAAGSNANDYETLVDNYNSASANRVIIRQNSTSTSWQLFADSAQEGGTADTDPHLLVAVLDGGAGDDSLDVDGVNVVTANAGNNVIYGVSIGGGPLGNFSSRGKVAMVGIYEGDITLDDNWAAFVAWVEEHYGLEIA